MVGASLLSGTGHEIPVAPVFDLIGVLGLLAGIAVIAAMLHKSRREDASHGVLHLFACVVGVLAYLSFLAERAVVHVGHRSFAVPHYVYWLVSEPVLVVAVALVALPPLSNLVEHRLRATLHGGLIGSVLVWVAGGLFQAWARSDTERWMWFAVAAAGVAATIWQLWGPVLHQGEIKGGEHLQDYRLLATSFSALSILYLLVWGLGESGLKLWSSKVDVPMFLVLDLLSDTGLGILSVVLIEHLSKHVNPEPGETSIAASARLARAV